MASASACGYAVVMVMIAVVVMIAVSVVVLDAVHANVLIVEDVIVIVETFHIKGGLEPLS